jgi:hypothetical protein
MKRLKELGLDEQKLGGTGLSDEGRKLPGRQSRIDQCRHTPPSLWRLPTQRVEPSERKSLRQIPSSNASPSLILGAGRPQNARSWFIVAQHAGRRRRSIGREHHALCWVRPLFRMDEIEQLFLKTPSNAQGVLMRRARPGEFQTCCLVSTRHRSAD